MFGFAAHHWFTLAWLIALVVAAPFIWHWLGEYKITADLEARLADEGKSLWAKLKLKLENLGAAILCGMVSVLGVAWDWFMSASHAAIHVVSGLVPDDLNPFKDATLLGNFFADGTVAKIVAGATFAGFIMAVKSRLSAAKLPPAA